PSAGVTRFPRYYGPFRLPAEPSLSLAGAWLGHVPTRRGLPCCVPSPCADMPSPLPRWDHGWDRFAPLEPVTAAFPGNGPGRLPRHVLSRLAQRSRKLRPACSPNLRSRPFAPEASPGTLPFLALRLLPAGATVAGWDLHPLKRGAFARRTRLSRLARGW